MESGKVHNLNEAKNEPAKSYHVPTHSKCQESKYSTGYIIFLFLSIHCTKVHVDISRLFFVLTSTVNAFVSCVFELDMCDQSSLFFFILYHLIIVGNVNV